MNHSYSSIHAAQVIESCERFKASKELYIKRYLEPEIKRITEPTPAKWFGLVKAKPGISKEAVLEKLKRESSIGYEDAISSFYIRYREVNVLQRLAEFSADGLVQLDTNDIWILRYLKEFNEDC